MRNRLLESLLVPVLAAVLLPAFNPVSAAASSIPTGGCSRPFGDSRVHCLFDATAGDEHWKVPTGVSFLLVRAWGGQGAPMTFSDGSGAAGGRGGGIAVGVDVASGEAITMRVGRRGGSAHAGPGRGQEAGGATTLSDAAGVWIAAGGGSAATRWTGDGVWYGDRAAEQSVTVRADRASFGPHREMRGTWGDGRISIIYHQHDTDGPPSVVVERVPGGGGRADVANFLVVFDEPVTGFTSDDLRLESAGARWLRATVRPAGPLDGTHFDVAVRGMSSGAVIVSVPAGAATDDDFSDNTESTFSGSG